MFDELVIGYNYSLGKSIHFFSKFLIKHRRVQIYLVICTGGLFLQILGLGLVSCNHRY